MTHKPTGIRVQLGKNLEEDTTIFVDLSGNSMTSTRTRKGAASLAKFLREAAQRVSDWEEWKFEAKPKKCRRMQ